MKSYLSSQPLVYYSQASLMTTVLMELASRQCEMLSTRPMQCLIITSTRITLPPSCVLVSCRGKRSYTSLQAELRAFCSLITTIVSCRQNRFGFSNPSPSYVASCTNAFRTGLYDAGSERFGSGKYGSLEAMAASIILGQEATQASLAVEMSHGSIREPILKTLALMRSMKYQTKIPDTLDGPPMHNDFQVRLWEIHEQIGQSPYEFPTVFSFWLPEYVPDNGPVMTAGLVGTHCFTYLASLLSHLVNPHVSS